MVTKKFTILVFFIGLFFPITLIGGEVGVEEIFRRYPDLNNYEVIVKKPLTKMGYYKSSGELGSSPAVVTTFRFSDPYEQVKELLESKGVHLEEKNSIIPGGKETEKDSQRVKPTSLSAVSLNPWKLSDFRQSTGKDDQDWKFVLTSHRFNVITREWESATILMVVIYKEKTWKDKARIELPPTQEEDQEIIEVPKQKEISKDKAEEEITFAPEEDQEVIKEPKQKEISKDKAEEESTPAPEEGQKTIKETKEKKIPKKNMIKKR